MTTLNVKCLTSAPFPKTSNGQLYGAFEADVSNMPSVSIAYVELHVVDAGADLSSGVIPVRFVKTGIAVFLDGAGDYEVYGRLLMWDRSFKFLGAIDSQRIAVAVA